jgi:hypothetical protein
VKPVPVFPARVDAVGTLQISDTQKQQIRRWTKTLKGHDVEVVIRKKEKRRSLGQNAWHWAVAVPRITAAAEMDPNDPHDCELVHYGLVAKCFGTTFNEKLGLELPNQRSSKLTTEQFSYLMEWEARFAAEEYGIYLEMPDEIRGAA